MRPLKITQSITQKETESFNKYLQEVSKNDVIDKDMENKLAIGIKQGLPGAQNALIKANLRFVISVAKQYIGRGLPMEDLVSEGNIGLIRAAHKFDPERGIKFISYAVWWIRQAIMQSLAEHSRMIRLPINQIATLNNINKKTSQFEMEWGRTPTTQELSQLLDISEDKIVNLMDSSKQTVSLDTPIGDESITTGDFIQSDSETDADIIQNDLQMQIKQVILLLDEREATIINKHFGIGCQSQSLADIADELNLSVERIRQIKNTALRKMRIKMR